MRTFVLDVGIYLTKRLFKAFVLSREQWYYELIINLELFYIFATSRLGRLGLARQVIKYVVVNSCVNYFKMKIIHSGWLKQARVDCG